jgi:hypothetical protein
MICPYCSRVISEVKCSSSVKSRPTPGDWGICSACSLPWIFDDSGELRKPTRADLDQLKSNEWLLRQLSDAMELSWQYRLAQEKKGN